MYTPVELQMTPLGQGFDPELYSVWQNPADELLFLQPTFPTIYPPSPTETVDANEEWEYEEPIFHFEMPDPFN